MKILDKRVLKIGNYEYPQIMVVKDIWEFCDGRPVFPIRFRKDTEELENFAQKFLDVEELKPERIKSDGYHAIENSEHVGGTLYKITSNVYLTLSQIDSLSSEELAKAFVPLETIEYIKNNLIIRD